MEPGSFQCGLVTGQEAMGLKHRKLHLECKEHLL